jgi:hypothetical protein
MQNWGMKSSLQNWNAVYEEKRMKNAEWSGNMDMARGQWKCR